MHIDSSNMLSVVRYAKHSIWEKLSKFLQYLNCENYEAFTSILTNCNCLNIMDLSAPQDTICSCPSAWRNRTAVIDDEWSSSVWRKLYS